MTDFVPSELAALPQPWNLTSGRARRESIAASTPDRDDQRAAGAVAALDVELAAYPDLTEPAEADLPEEFTDYFDFTAEWLAERMPTLADISTATITAMLADRTAVPASDVPPSSVDALGRLWVRTMVIESVQDCLALLTDLPPGRAADARLGSILSPAVRDALAGIVRRELPRQPTYVASILLGALAGLGGAADGLLDEVAATGDGATLEQGSAVDAWSRLDPEIRGHARSLRVWRESIKTQEAP